MEFVDAQKRHRKNPKTFEIPSIKEIEKISVGDFVKIATGGERFWVKVTKLDGKCFTGLIKNDLLFTQDHQLKRDDAVTFRKKHIMEIMLVKNGA